MKEKTKERIDITIDKELKKKLRDLNLNVSRLCEIALTAYIYNRDPSKAIEEEMMKFEDKRKKKNVRKRQVIHETICS